jgi:uncharacterized protein (DUF952 family)
MILHFCPRAVWEAAGPDYAADTLATQGFIHCSTADHLTTPANALARGRTDLVVLEVDESRLTSPVRWEPGDPADEAGTIFPHVYGPIAVDAVVAVHAFPPGPDGFFSLPPGLRTPPAAPAPSPG